MIIALVNILIQPLKWVNYICSKLRWVSVDITLQGIVDDYCPNKLQYQFHDRVF